MSRKRRTFRDTALDAALVGSAFDAFRNEGSRLGFGTPNLLGSTSYPLSRFSFDYWGLISLYEDHWICRRIVDVVAQDMVRTWPKITGEIDPEDMDRVEKCIQRTLTRQSYLTGLQWGRLFGGAGSLIVIEGHEDRLEEPLDLDDVMPGSYKGLIPFDMWAGIQPDPSSICVDFDRPEDVNKPEFYNVQLVGGERFRVHSSRILRHVGYTNPTPERETYQWWGISVLQPVIQEIEKRDNVSWNIAGLTFRANILGMKDKELAERLSGLGAGKRANQQWERRMAETNRLLSNQSLLIVPPDGGIEATQYSFAGIPDTYVMFQLDVAGAAEIPFTRLWGRTVTGLGQTNESDEKLYEERIAKEQSIHMRPGLEGKLLPVIMMSELGEVPDDFTLDFPSVRVPSEQEKAEQAKTVVDACTVALNSSIISPQQFAKELIQASQKTGLFTNISDEYAASLSDKPIGSSGESDEDMFGEEEGEPVLDPSGSPERVLREEGREKYQQEGGRAADADSGQFLRTVGPFQVVVETPKGGWRTGPGWRNRMPADYGYLVGYAGADGDSLDVYLGPHEDSDAVYVVDQMRLDKPRQFDEHKTILGCRTRNEALDLYMKGHHRSGTVFGAITPMTMDGFKDWLRTADLSKPCASKVRGRLW